MKRYLPGLLGVGGAGPLLVLLLALPGASAPPGAHKPDDSATPIVGHAATAPKPGFRPAHVTAKAVLTAASAAVFPPIRGTTLAPGSTPNFSLRSPTVNVVFHGSNWTAADKQTVLNGVQAILSGPFLSALDQPNYGSDGKALWGTSLSSTARLDLDTPFAGGKYPSAASLAAFMKSVSTANNPNTVNVAVNDPKSSQGAVGVNVHVANGAQIYVGTQTAFDGSFDKDGFTALFSHEIAEAMCAGVKVTDPGMFNLGDQICDNEPEVKGYYAQTPGTYIDANGKRVSTTSMAQAYWSQKDGAFIVPTAAGPGTAGIHPLGGKPPEKR
jgi:hypothetical protein